MQPLANRILTVVSIPAVLMLIGVLISVAVVYKPWGVHDLELDKYEAIVTEAKRKQVIIAQDRPIFEFTGYDSKKDTVQPGELIESAFTISNTGQQPLEFSLPESLPESIHWTQPPPTSLLPSQEATVKFQWTAPESRDDFGSLRFSVKTNDPLNEHWPISPSCKLATAFGITHTQIGEAATFGNPIDAVNQVFSQRFDDFTIIDIEADDRLIVDIKALKDSELLKQLDAKSGMSVHVQLPPGQKIGPVDLPIRVKAESGDHSEWLEFKFSGKVKNPIAFIGPQLDTRTGWELGIIKVGDTRKWSFFARVDEYDPVDGLEVEVKPDGLMATIEPARKDSNDFRVTLSLKPDAKPYDFQAARQGYVSVTSKSDPTITHWMPILGVIIADDKN